MIYKTNSEFWINIIFMIYFGFHLLFLTRVIELIKLFLLRELLLVLFGPANSCIASSEVLDPGLHVVLLLFRLKLIQVRGPSHF